jgi:hypothetical protein
MPCYPIAGLQLPPAHLDDQRGPPQGTTTKRKDSPPKTLRSTINPTLPDKIQFTKRSRCRFAAVRSSVRRAALEKSNDTDWAWSRFRPGDITCARRFWLNTSTRSDPQSVSQRWVCVAKAPCPHPTNYQHTTKTKTEHQANVTNVGWVKPLVFTHKSKHDFD